MKSANFGMGECELIASLSAKYILNSEPEPVKTGINPRVF